MSFLLQPINPAIRDFIAYDAETGVLTWLRNRAGKALAGTQAGSVHATRDGGRYIRLKFMGMRIFAHRVAWFLATGEDRVDLDHSDRDGTNNRLNNLRVATRSQQAANRRGPRSKPKGVYLTPAGTYIARISVGGQKCNLGTFCTEAEAIAAYAKRAKEAFGDFANIS